MSYVVVFHTQASYALGYNLAIEYLADYEKTWMLDSFRELDSRVREQSCATKLTGLWGRADFRYSRVGRHDLDRLALCVIR